MFRAVQAFAQRFAVFACQALHDSRAFGTALGNPCHSSRTLSNLTTLQGALQRHLIAGMDHSHMDHGGMDMGGDQCSMNVRFSATLPAQRSFLTYQMLFTWDTSNLCIIFRQWRITGTTSLLLSLAAIALLTAGYEAVREISRQYEQNHATRMSAFSSSASSKLLFVIFKPNDGHSKLKLARGRRNTK